MNTSVCLPPAVPVRLAVSLACALLLGGCAPGAPSLAQPDPGVLPGQWPSDSHATPVTAALPDWQQWVQDPTLAQLQTQALAHNRDLRLALLRVEEARAVHGLQRADRFPTVAVGSSHARARVPGDLNVSGRPVTGSDHEVFVGLNSWELDLWGRVRSLDEAALQQYLASAAGARAAQLTLLGQVARSYLALRETDERLHLARSTLDTRAETQRIFTRRHEVGSTSKYALTQVQSLYNQAHALVVQLQQARAQQVHALGQLTGQAIDPLPALPPGAAILGEVPAGLPSHLLQARPDIVAAEHPAAGRPRPGGGRPRGLLPADCADWQLRHGQRPAGRPVREWQQGLDLCPQHLPAHPGRGPPPRQPGPGHGAPAQRRGQLRAQCADRLPRGGRCPVGAPLPGAAAARAAGQPAGAAGAQPPGPAAL